MCQDLHTCAFFGRRTLWLRLGDAFRDETGQLLIICHTADDEVQEQKKAKAWYRSCVNMDMGPTKKLWEQTGRSEMLLLVMVRADQGKSQVKTQPMCQLGSKQKAVLPQCCAQGHKPWWAFLWSCGHISEGHCHTANDGISHGWHLQRVYSVTWITPMDNKDMNVKSNSGGMESTQKKQTILFCQSLAVDTQNASKYIVSKVEIFKQRENKEKMKIWEFYQSRWAVWWGRVG